MREGIKKCPKCKGQGKIRYRVWDSHSIIGYFVAYNKGKSLSETLLILRLLKITCPLCRGDGVYDWIKAARHDDILNNFDIVAGNMDIYFAKCANKWIPNPTHQMRWIRVYRMFRNPRRLIELSQKHYTNIKLNERILSMPADKLLEITKKCLEYSRLLLYAKEDELTGKKIQEILKSIGLSNFVPDEFAYPGKFDYPI